MKADRPYRRGGSARSGAGVFVTVWRIRRDAHTRPWPRGRLAAAVPGPIIALVLAWALVVQAPSANQTSHYALIRSLAAGTARIDAYATETIDKSAFDGHLYSNKAPGLALATAPVYDVLQTTGLTALARHAAGSVVASGAVAAKTGAAASVRADRGIIWMLTLWAVVLPGAVLLLLIRAVCERVEPGCGTLAAVALGMGTLIMPFGTLLYSHVLAATLAFAGFATLFLGPAGSSRRLLGAGLLCGLAVTTEYPLSIVGGLLGLYVIARERSIRSASLYAAGLLAGLIPLAVYDQLAFGSITHLSYAGALPTTAAAVSPHTSGVFGVGFPQPHRALAVLLAPKGLLVLTPLLAAAIGGLVLVRRGAHRRENWLAGAILIAFWVYNAGYFGPLGGQTPGARFMIAALPYSAFGIAAALRRWRGPVLALLAASVATMVLATITEPQIGSSNLVAWTSLAGHDDLQYTLLGAVGLGHGWGPALPVVALLALALVTALRPVLRLTTGQALAGAAALGIWIGIVLLAPVVSAGTALPAGLVGAACGLALLVTGRFAPPRRAGYSAAVASAAPPAGRGREARTTARSRMRLGRADEEVAER